MNESSPLPPAQGRPTPELPELSHQQRLSLVRAFQQQALQRPDPLAASLGILLGDMMAMAHTMGGGLLEALGPQPATGEAGQRQRAQRELYLKTVRQFDRLAQLDRQLPPSSRGAPGYR